MKWKYSFLLIKKGDTNKVPKWVQSLYSGFTFMGKKYLDSQKATLTF